MESSALCLLIGPLISFVVSILKKIPLVKRWPKTATLFISSIIGTWTATHGTPPGIDYAAIVQCVLMQFSAGVATHEAVTNQVQKVISVGDKNSI